MYVENKLFCIVLEVTSQSRQIFLSFKNEGKEDAVVVVGVPRSTLIKRNCGESHAITISENTRYKGVI